MHPNVIRATARHLLPLEAPKVARVVEPSALEGSMIDLAHRFNSFSKVFFRIRVNGPRISAGDVTAALAAVQKKHPILRTRPIVANGRIFLEETQDVKIPVQERTYHGDETWREIHKTESENRSLRFGEDPNQAYLVQPAGSDGGRQDLILDFQHYTIDGVSAPHFVDELLSLISGQLDISAISNGKWPTANCHSLEETLQAMPPLKRLHTKYIQPVITLNKMSTNGITAPPPFGAVKFPVQTKQKRSEQPFANYCHGSRETLEKKHVDALVQHCRFHQISMTTLITAVFTTSVAETLVKVNAASGRFRIGASVVGDARAHMTPRVDHRELSVHAGSGVMVGTAWQRWDDHRPSDKELIKLAQRFKDQLANKGDRMGMFILTPYFFRLLPIPDSMPGPTFALSSWNAKNPIKDQYGSIHVEDVDVLQGGSGMVPPLLSTYRTLGGRMGFSFMAPAPRFHTGHIDMANAAAVDRLREFAEGQHATR